MQTRSTKEFRFAAPVVPDLANPAAAKQSNPELTEQDVMDVIAAHRNLLRLLFVVTIGAVLLRGPFA